MGCGIFSFNLDPFFNQDRRLGKFGLTVEYPTKSSYRLVDSFSYARNLDMLSRQGRDQSCTEIQSTEAAICMSPGQEYLEPLLSFFELLLEVTQALRCEPGPWRALSVRLELRT